MLIFKQLDNLEFSFIDSDAVDNLIPEPIRSVFPNSLPAMFFPMDIKVPGWL